MPKRQVGFFFIVLMLFITKPYALDVSSDITLQNGSGATTYNITGIYVQALETGAGCDALGVGTNPPAHGSAYGAMWTGIGEIAPGETVTIGANYLYQVVNNLIYQVYEDGGSINGANCTPGTGQCGAGNVPDTNQWCINLGIITGDAVASTTAINGANDILSLANSTQIQITCTDKDGSDNPVLTCIANTPVTQSFP